jgi:hypothetical protein
MTLAWEGQAELTRAIVPRRRQFTAEESPLTREREDAPPIASTTASSPGERGKTRPHRPGTGPSISLTQRTPKPMSGSKERERGRE